ncbi:hypothetical protein P7K49_014313 [Saguinus oedipus]|uniref:Uncharacterized protein n=1 Tax=Saguinus oedipus TaxID=9490 RepID=A0ABQ9VKQ0_SAGOE|nr:hypothetical protein P7K49_014313 [Saguinus oedipus]
MLGWLTLAQVKLKLRVEFGAYVRPGPALRRECGSKPWNCPGLSFISQHLKRPPLLHRQKKRCQACGRVVGLKVSLKILGS